MAAPARTGRTGGVAVGLAGLTGEGRRLNPDRVCDGYEVGLEAVGGKLGCG
jgi:hypothetical protein